jgi:hypothetical protein
MRWCPHRGARESREGGQEGKTENPGLKYAISIEIKAK